MPSELGWLLDELADHAARIATLEAPSGADLASSVQKLTDLVANIEATLADFIANDVQAIVDAAINTRLAGNISIGGTLDVAGAVTMLGMRNTDITAEASRVVVWVAGNGKVGHT